MQDPQNNRTELLPLRTGAGRQENVSPSSRGRKMSLTSPLIDQAITLIDPPEEWAWGVVGVVAIVQGPPEPSRLPCHTPTQDPVDLPKMVQVVCRFQADELLDRLPSAYLVDPVELHPPCARDRLQQSQVALAQHPKDPCRKARILLRVTQALRPCRLIPPR